MNAVRHRTTAASLMVMATVTMVSAAPYKIE